MRRRRKGATGNDGGEKKSREGEENWIQVRPVGVETKERKNDVDRIKAACEERKLNTTQSSTIALLMRSSWLWDDKRKKGRQISLRNKENENLNEMNKNTGTWKILRKNTPREGYLHDGSGGNYFTTDDKNSKSARRTVKKCKLKEGERYPGRTAKWRKRKWKWSGHGGQRGIKKTTKEGA